MSHATRKILIEFQKLIEKKWLTLELRVTIFLNLLWSLSQSAR